VIDYPFFVVVQKSFSSFVSIVWRVRQKQRRVKALIVFS